jgi:hypothetical protein
MRAHEHPEGVYTGDYGPDGKARLAFTPACGAPSEPVPILFRHSPNGVAWGYTGHGAAECAFSSLAHATTEHHADTPYQDFKREVIAQLPTNEPFRLDPATLQRWLADTGIAPGAGRELVAVPSQPTRPGPYPDWDADPAFSHAYGDDDHARARQLDARARELADWERRLDQRERRLDKRAAALDDISDIAPAWTAPAEPVRCQLEWYLNETGDDIDTVAKGLDLEPEWVTSVLDGTTTEVDLDHIQRLCESLHCNPFDLWGSQVGRSLLYAYGPELWPNDTQPLTGSHRDPDPPGPGPHHPPEPPGLEL